MPRVLWIFSLMFSTWGSFSSFWRVFHLGYCICGRWRQQAAQLRIEEELGGHGWTHPVRALCRVEAVREPGARADGMPGPSQKSQRTLEILISGRSVVPLRLWSSCSVDSRHVQWALAFQITHFSCQNMKISPLESWQIKESLWFLSL